MDLLLLYREVGKPRLSQTATTSEDTIRLVWNLCYKAALLLYKSVQTTKSTQSLILPHIRAQQQQNYKAINIRNFQGWAIITNVSTN